MSFSGLLRVFNNVPFIKGVYFEGGDFGNPPPPSHENVITEDGELVITEDGDQVITE